MLSLILLAWLASPSGYRDVAVTYEAERLGVNPRLALAVSHVENWGGKRDAVSRTGCCVGVMQVNVAVWHSAFLEECGDGSLTDVSTNACVGVAILRTYLRRHKSIAKALAGYYGEPSDGSRYVRKVENKLRSLAG